MTQEEIQIIIDSDLSSMEKSNLLSKIFELKNKDVKMFLEGGNMNQEIAFNFNPTVDIKIGGKPYKVQLAETDSEKEIGLSKIDQLPEGTGMLFVYDDEQEEVWYTMQDTSVDLDIIFIDEEGEVISVHSVKAHDPNEVYEQDVQFVLEVGINSGIKSGDDLEGLEEAVDPSIIDDDYLESDFDDEDRETAKQSKMLVLDENGDVQMKLEGGERIFSRISTRKFIKAALKAYRSDDKDDYEKVGKLVFKELNALDGRDPEYVTKPE